MNSVVEEMNDYLIHYGMPRRSGRYPWGSGEDPYQHSRDLLGRIEQLKKDGWTETPENIMKEFGLTTTQYRAQKSLAKDERRMLQVATAKSLKEDGLGTTEIGKKMGLPESTVRSLLDQKSEARMMAAKNTADFIREKIETEGMIDVGSGVEHELNISKEKLNQALAILESEGYPILGGGIPQVTNKGQQINQKVICPKDTPYRINDKGQKVSSAVYDYGNIHSLKEYTSNDNGETYQKKFTYPESLDSKRLMIRYKEDGGIDKDGIVELRRGVEDLSLGNSRYSQVRIMVDQTHYIKGMAVYSDNMPDGVDVIFNTNKTKDVPMLGPKDNTVLKTIKKDPENPFGSAIKDADQGGQYWYTDAQGNKKLGLINKRADEGDWSEWKDKLPAQFLSKQSLPLAKQQLKLAVEDKEAEYNEICSLTNPTIKKHLLNKFADECDSAAVHLQAAALPGQRYHVIVPINTLKDNEVYAPNYENGTKLALVRYPHEGIFQIPILTVNNKNKLAQEILGKDVTDVVGITSKVAEKLSGADFDGDTVMCIPTHDKEGRVKISSRDQLEGLKDYDHKAEYGWDDIKVDSQGESHYYRNGKEFKIMKNTQNEMGRISNLITDMTLQGATDDELAAAVRHSMLVIDAEKHKLDYKQSEIDNNISALKKKYQPDGGASTLISKSKGQETVNKRQGTPQVNLKGKAWYDPTKPEGSLIYKTADDLYYPIRKYDKDTKQITLTTSDGKKIKYSVEDRDAHEYYKPVKRESDTGEVYFTNKDGTVVYKQKPRTQKSTRMAETDDARTLLSETNTPMENLYADYANSMKAIANKARVEVSKTGKVAYSKNSKEKYHDEVESLDTKLKEALVNAPRERQAQRKANVEIDEKIREATESGSELKKDDIKKVSQKSLNKYRTSLGSVSRRDRSIDITDREWEAIQAGAISETTLIKILNNTDVDKLRQRATPKTTTTLSQAKINKLQAMKASNKYTNAEIAQALGISVSTVSNYLKG